MKLNYLLAGAAALVSVPALAVPQTPITITKINGDAPVVSTHSQTVADSTIYSLTSSTDVSAFVDFGVIKVKSSAAIDGTSHTRTAGTSIMASTVDYLNIVAPPGVSAGLFTGHLIVDAGLTSNVSQGTSGGESAFSNASVTLERVDTAFTFFDLRLTQSTYGGGGFPNFSSSSTTLNGLPIAINRYHVFDFDIFFTDLNPIALALSVTCSSNANTLNNTQFATSDCALDRSIYWGGISNPVDQNGAPIAGFQLNGADGFNYNNASPLAPSAAPEPASWALLIIGFGLTGAMQRRQRPVAA